MSVVRFIPNTNRLAKKLGLPGGKRISAALADAEAALEEIRPPCLERIDETLSEITGLVQAQGPITAERLERIYRLADEISALAPLFGLVDMGKAAWFVCELTDSSHADDAMLQETLQVHVHSLQLLRAGDAKSEHERQAVLAALERLMHHKS